MKIRVNLIFGSSGGSLVEVLLLKQHNRLQINRNFLNNKIKEIFDPKLGARNSYSQRPDIMITDQGSQITKRRSLIADHK